MLAIKLSDARLEVGSRVGERCSGRLVGSRSRPAHLKMNRSGPWLSSFALGRTAVPVSKRFLHEHVLASAEVWEALCRGCFEAVSNGQLLRRRERSDWELMRDIVTESVSRVVATSFEESTCSPGTSGATAAHARRALSLCERYLASLNPKPMRNRFVGVQSLD